MKVSDFGKVVTDAQSEIKALRNRLDVLDFNLPNDSEKQDIKVLFNRLQYTIQKFESTITNNMDKVLINIMNKEEADIKFPNITQNHKENQFINGQFNSNNQINLIRKQKQLFRYKNQNLSNSKQNNLLDQTINFVQISKENISPYLQNIIREQLEQTVESNKNSINKDVYISYKKRQQVGRISKTADVIPPHIRNNPFIDTSPINEEDINHGVYNLLNRGVIPKDVDIQPAFEHGVPPLNKKPANFYHFQQKLIKQEVNTESEKQNQIQQFKLDVRSASQQKAEINQFIKTNITLRKNRSKSIKDRGRYINQHNQMNVTNISIDTSQNQQVQQNNQINYQTQIDINSPNPKSYNEVLDTYSLHHLIIRKGQLIEDTPEFQSYKRIYSSIWGNILSVINQLVDLAVDYNFQILYIDGKKIAKLSEKLKKPSRRELLECVVNQSIIQDNAQLSKDLTLTQAQLDSIARKIQATWKMHKQLQEFAKIKETIKKVRLIQTNFRIHLLYQKTKNNIQEKNQAMFNSYKELSQIFNQEWDEIKLQSRVEIHINSFSFEELQRLTISNRVQRENTQITRIFSIINPDITIIYICPFDMNNEIIQYYYKILELGEIPNYKDRLYFIKPENSEIFPNHFSLTKKLLYSPKAIKRIKNLVKGRTSYIVTGYPSNDDVKLAAILKIPLQSGDPQKSFISSTKSQALRLLSQSEIPIGPHALEIYDEDELINSLTILILNNKEISTWLIKIDDEFNGRGIGSFNINKIKVIQDIIQQAEPPFTSDIIDQIRLLVRQYLPIKLVVAMPSLYRNYSEFSATIRKHGCIIEAQSPNNQRMMINSSTVSLFIEPSGNGFKVIGTFDKITGLPYINIGCSFPSRQFPNQFNFKQLCEKLVFQLYDKGIYGYVSVDFVIFVDKSQHFNFWAIGLDCFLNNNVSSFLYFHYLMNGQYDADSNQYITTLQDANQIHASLQSQNLIQQNQNKKQIQQQRCYCYIPFIHHEGLTNVQLKTFFQMCRLEAISFDLEKKFGISFVLTDIIQSGVVGLLTIGEDFRISMKLMNLAFSFLIKHAGSSQKSYQETPINITRVDEIFLVDILSRIRIINKRLEQGDQMKPEIKERNPEKRNETGHNNESQTSSLMKPDNQ